jgi:hypothetical protein
MKTIKLVILLILSLALVLVVALLVKNDAKSKPETGWTANIVLPGKGGPSARNL